MTFAYLRKGTGMMGENFTDQVESPKLFEAIKPVKMDGEDLEKPSTQSSNHVRIKTTQQNLMEARKKFSQPNQSLQISDKLKAQLGYNDFSDIYIGPQHLNRRAGRNIGDNTIDLDSKPLDVRKNLNRNNNKSLTAQGSANDVKVGASQRDARKKECLRKKEENIKFVR